MLKVDDISKVRGYANSLIRQLKWWKDTLHITPESHLKMEDKDLDKVYKDVFGPIKRIVEHHNDFILTDDFLFYLAYKSMRFVDYSKDLVKELNDLVVMDDTKLAKKYKKYFDEVMFGKYLHDFASEQDFIDIMDEDHKNAFSDYKDNYNKLHGIFIRGYEFDVMDNISSIIYSKCAKTNNLPLYKKLSKKYFDDPRQTIDYFSMNGFIREDYDLIDDFNEYINNDMNNIGSKNVIR